MRENQRIIRCDACHPPSACDLCGLATHVATPGSRESLAAALSITTAGRNPLSRIATHQCNGWSLGRKRLSCSRAAISSQRKVAFCSNVADIFPSNSALNTTSGYRHAANYFCLKACSSCSTAACTAAKNSRSPWANGSRHAGRQSIVVLIIAAPHHQHRQGRPTAFVRGGTIVVLCEYWCCRTAA